MNGVDQQINDIVASMLDAVSSGDDERVQIYLREFAHHEATAVGDAVDAAATCRKVLQRLNLIDEPNKTTEKHIAGQTGYQKLFKSVVVFN